MLWMKRLVALGIATLCVGACLVSCSGKTEPTEEEKTQTNQEMKNVAAKAYGDGGIATKGGETE